MYTIFVETHFSAAHRLRNYHGKCERIHGHNWRVQSYISGPTPDPTSGMLLDFKMLKANLEKVLELFDHHDLNELECFAVAEPSAENIARIICDELGKLVNTEAYWVSKIMVWEGPTSCAIYEPG